MVEYCIEFVLFDQNSFMFGRYTWSRFVIMVKLPIFDQFQFQIESLLHQILHDELNFLFSQYHRSTVVCLLNFFFFFNLFPHCSEAYLRNSFSFFFNHFNVEFVLDKFNYFFLNLFFVNIIKPF